MLQPKNRAVLAKKKRDSIKVMSVDIKWTPDTNNLK